MEPYLTATCRLQPSLMLFVHLWVTRTKSWSVGTQSKISRNTDHSRGSHWILSILSIGQSKRPCFFTDNRPFILNGLLSGTRYAFYVEVVGEKEVLQISQVEYFWTKKTRPAKDRPCSVTAWPYPTLMGTESALKVEWALAPRTAFNNRFIYLVTGEHLKDTATPCSSQKFQRFSKSFFVT